LAKKFSSLNKAEENFQLDVDAYLMEESSKQSDGHISPSFKLQDSSSTLDLQPTRQYDNHFNTPGLEADGVDEIMINQLLETSNEGILQKIADKAFYELAVKNGISSNPEDFASTSVMAMKRLQAAGKNNLLYKFAECIAKNRPGSQERPMPINKMPFGLIEYQLEFFTCNFERCY